MLADVLQNILHIALLHYVQLSLQPFWLFKSSLKRRSTRLSVSQHSRVSLRSENLAGSRPRPSTLYQTQQDPDTAAVEHIVFYQNESCSGDFRVWGTINRGFRVWVNPYLLIRRWHRSNRWGQAHSKWGAGACRSSRPQPASLLMQQGHNSTPKALIWRFLPASAYGEWGWSRWWCWYMTCVYYKMDTLVNVVAHRDK